MRILLQMYRTTYQFSILSLLIVDILLVVDQEQNTQDKHTKNKK